MMALVILALVLIPMLIEARRADRNERVQHARGGIEPPGDVYNAMRIAYPAAFFLMMGEGLMRGIPSGSMAAGGAVLFVGAKLLKWWAILSLGSFWTFRVVVVPGSRLVTSGPYRFMPHPNYLAVAGELIAVAMMTGARITGPLVTVGFGLLMLRRISVERHALDALCSDRRR